MLCNSVSAPIWFAFRCCWSSCSLLWPVAFGRYSLLLLLLLWFGPLGCCCCFAHIQGICTCLYIWGSCPLGWILGSLCFGLFSSHCFFLLQILHGIFQLLHLLCLAFVGVHWVPMRSGAHHPSIVGILLFHLGSLCEFLGFPWLSVLISSIKSAYCRTDSTPPWRMLSFIFISLVLPCLVLSCAVRFSFIFLLGPIPGLLGLLCASHTLWHPAMPCRRLLWHLGIPCILGVFCLRISLMVSFSTTRWSVVALPFCPPAWFSVMFIFSLALLLSILSNSLPKLLARVIPLSFEHLPLLPLPLYSRIICPFCHCSGMSLLSAIVCSAFLYTSIVWGSALVKM